MSSSPRVKWPIDLGPTTNWSTWMNEPFMSSVLVCDANPRSETTLRPRCSSVVGRLRVYVDELLTFPSFSDFRRLFCHIYKLLVMQIHGHAGLGEREREKSVVWWSWSVRGKCINSNQRVRAWTAQLDMSRFSFNSLDCRHRRNSR